MKYRVKVVALPENGFRRAGFAFTREAKEVTVDAAQLKALQEEKMLVVQVLEEISEESTGKTSTRPNAKDTIEKLKGAGSLEELNALLEGEDRSSVLAEAEKLKAKFQQA